ncbi:hypothetical protein DJ568_09080 [Mucilaginibacter hurinus]|uniref:Uncharacterized protein n=1 Tax=Mucilaginibacter hurinus TaxID=2201324 RepID=A0A367GRI6_9SPHI|nr:hypothetical protein [Mucilaginibacter hurinus]RCH55323.1 hypothetical protein DJ568_09080 [Mucilaginibacter hurinus]
MKNKLILACTSAAIILASCGNGSPDSATDSESQGQAKTFERDTTAQSNAGSDTAKPYNDKPDANH